jgi:hypothetical protein
VAVSGPRLDESPRRRPWLTRCMLESNTSVAPGCGSCGNLAAPVGIDARAGIVRHASDGRQRWRCHSAPLGSPQVCDGEASWRLASSGRSRTLCGPDQS